MSVRKGNGRFLQNLEKAIEAILADDKANAQEKVKAIEAGARLLAIRHKIAVTPEEKSYFDGN
jgi:hypothetical protein